MKYVAMFFAVLFGGVSFICIIGYLELLVGLIPTDIPVLSEGTVEYELFIYELIGRDIFTIIIIVVCIILSSFFFSLYHRLNKKKKDTFNINNIKGPFVLYLRSFIDDKTTRKRVSPFIDIRSEEEVLVEVLSDIAPVYAIGDPKDKKMPIGASRVYVDDEHWKSTVINMAKRAVVVVLRLGKTDSFWWEVDMVMKNIPIGKVLFAIPESKTFSDVSILYKILLDNNIDIKSLDVKIGKNLNGSISSFLFFDNDGNPVAKEVKIRRFTRLIISYENVIRNALEAFRSKFGLHTNHKTTFRYARIFQILLILFLLFIASNKMFNDYIELKYQMPYELVEKCIESPDFVKKYSSDINGTNLSWGLIESTKGCFALEDEEYKFIFMVETEAIISMSDDEFSQLETQAKNRLLMVKKYVPDSYDLYVEILSKAAIIAIQHPHEIDELILQYKSNTDSMPQWIIDFFDSEDYTEDIEINKSMTVKFNNMVISHYEDENIVDIMKTLTSQGMGD